MYERDSTALMDGLEIVPKLRKQILHRAQNRFVIARTKPPSASPQPSSSISINESRS
jgi:hypothetical protein